MQETHFLVHRTQPLLLPVNKEGYTVLAHSECPEEVPSLAWRLNLISPQPLQGWSQLPSSRQDLFEGKARCLHLLVEYPLQSLLFSDYLL